MATTSLSLGEHWEVFIRNEVASGRYGSASEVVRDTLRAHLDEGAQQARRGEFVENYSIKSLIFDLDNEVHQA
jgi:antitoxin ParD1/3/4